MPSLQPLKCRCGHTVALVSKPEGIPAYCAGCKPAPAPTPTATVEVEDGVAYVRVGGVRYRVSQP